MENHELNIAMNKENQKKIVNEIKDVQLRIERLHEIREGLSFWNFYKRWKIDNEICAAEIYLMMLGGDLSNCL